MPSTTEIVTASVTALSVLGNVVLAFWLQQRSIATTEYNIALDTCRRLREEKTQLSEQATRDKAELNQQIGKLQERTDLQPVMSAILEWRTEGRERFTAATDQLRENTEALKMLVGSNTRILEQLTSRKARRRAQPLVEQ